MRRIIRRASHLLDRRRRERELAEEIETHRLLVEQRLRDSGLPAGEVAAASRRLMGNVTLAREEARAAWIVPWVESVAQDVVYGVRQLRAHPAPTAAATLSLVVAAVLITSFFTFFAATFLRPWPVPAPDRVVLLHAHTADAGARAGFLLSDARYVAQQSRSFAGVAAIRGGGGRVAAAPGPDSHFVQTGFVTAAFFDALQVPLALGRGFLPAEDDAASPGRVVVIGAGLWHRAFGADPQILDRTIYVGNEPMTVVGVTAPGLGGSWPFTNELWLPMATAVAARSLADCCVGVAGRLRPGVTHDQAAAEVAVLMRQLDDAAQRAPRTVVISGTRSFEQPGGARRALPFALFFAALLVVLLLACANVANLQLARSLARRRELAIRLSLGAGRGRIVRQLITEAVLIAGAAAAIALAASYVVPGAVLRAAGDPAPMPMRPDGTALGFTVMLAIAMAVLTGLAPALRGTRDAADFIAVQRGAVAVRRPLLRGALLGVHIASGATLLFAASLLTRALVHASTTNPGYEVEAVSVARIGLPSGAYNAAASAAFMSSVLDAVKESPLGAAGLADPLPLQPSRLIADVRRPEDARDDVRTVHLRPLTPRALAVLRIPLVAGRMFDARPGSREVLVNETLARTFWAGAPAVGQQLIARSATYDVVGVVRDVRYTDLGAIEPVLHHPRLLSAVPPLLVRASGPDAAARIRAIVGGLEPRATVTVTPLTDTVRESLRDSYTSATIAWVLGALAVCLAAVGVFGVFCYVVEERAREIGIRMALGARASEVLALVFRATRLPVLAGLGAALLLSALTGHVLRAFLFGLSPMDPLAWSAAAALLAIAAASATAIPVWRATRVDPLAVLRLD